MPVQPSRLSLFHGLRANIRIVLFCSLLLTAHILLSTTASLDLLPPNHESDIDGTTNQPVRPQLFPRLSGLIFFTLLWQALILFEQVPVHSVDRSKVRARRVEGRVEAMVEKSTDPNPIECVKVETGGESNGAMLFSTTAMEAIMGLVVLGLWLVSIPTVHSVCEMYAPIIVARIPYAPAILPSLFMLSGTCILALHAQLAIELTRRASTGDLGHGWWAAPTGAWPSRATLNDSSYASDEA